MTNQVRKNGKKRIILKWWHKILLILGCTALCVLAAWLLCEKIMAPSYVDTVKATLEIDKDAMESMKSQNSEYMEDVLDIRANLKTQLEDGGTGEEKKGLYYRSLYEELNKDPNVQDTVANHRDIEKMITIGTASGEDGKIASVRIQLDNTGDEALTDDDFRILLEEAGDTKRLRNAISEATGISVKLDKPTYYIPEPENAGNKAPEELTDEELRQVKITDKTEQSSVWVLSFKVSKADITDIPSDDVRSRYADTLNTEYEKKIKRNIIGDPSVIRNMISPDKNIVSVKNADDDAHQSIRIVINKESNQRMPDDVFRMLVQAAGDQFGKLVFGEIPEKDRMTRKIAYRGGLKDGVEGTKDPANYQFDDYEWIDADPADQNVRSDVWMVTVTFSKAAVDALPNRGEFYNREMDLQDLLAANMTDEHYRQIASEAGADVKPEELRKQISFPMTDNEKTLEVIVTSDNGQEEAVRIAAATIQQAVKVITGTLRVTDVTIRANTERNKYELGKVYGETENTETALPELWEVVSKAGAYVQSFYSDRPQFRTDMAMIADARALGLTDYFNKETGKDGESAELFEDLAKAWSKKELLSEEGQEAFTGIAGGSSPYTLTEQAVREAFFLEDDPQDLTGRTVLVHADTGMLIAFIREKIEGTSSGAENKLHKDLEGGKIDNETHEKAIELISSQKAVLLEAADGIADTIEADIIRQIDVLFFGYGGEKDAFRSIRSESGIITYTVTDEGLDHLKDDCYLNQPENQYSPEEMIRGLDSGDAYQQILQEADASGSGDVLKNSMEWSGDNRLTLRVSWSDKTTTGAVGRAAMTVLSRQMTKASDGRALRMVIDPNETRILREQARQNPPATLPTMVIAGIIALLISYIIFSRQPLFDSLVVILFVIFTFICIFPFYYLFINTISDNTKVAAGRINFLPEGIHLKNYERIFSQQELGDAVIVTVARTILGTALMVLTSAWAGYLVTKRKMWHRSFWYRALVITMYFNAGLIPWYTNMLMLGLTNNFLAYIIPGMVAPYNIILVKTYIESIPGSLEESAIIDGASTGKVFLRIILPLSIPILATIAIFGAVGNWNSFQDSLLLMGSSPKLYTLQHRLYIYLNQTTSINTEQISEQMAQNLMNNGVTTKYTIAMVTILPILLVYPVMQRYFVKGIMLGAVKG